MTVLNADRLMLKLQQFAGKLENPVETALLDSADDMKTYAADKIEQNSGTGRVYRRHGREHIASSPGEFPNRDTGELIESMYAELRGYLSAVWAIGSDHAKPLEMGTSRMLPRPFVRPTFMARIEAAKARVGDAMSKVVNGR